MFVGHRGGLTSSHRSVLVSDYAFRHGAETPSIFATELLGVAHGIEHGIEVGMRFPKREASCRCQTHHVNVRSRDVRRAGERRYASCMKAAPAAIAALGRRAVGRPVSDVHEASTNVRSEQQIGWPVAQWILAT